MTPTNPVQRHARSTLLCYSSRGRLSMLTRGLALGALLLAGACDRKDSAHYAVEEAQRLISILTADGGGMASTSAERLAKLTEAYELVKEYAKDNPAAAVIASRARAALAQIDAQKAAELDQAAVDILGSLRRSLALYTQNSAVAAMLANVDLTEQTASVSAQIRQIDAELGGAQTQAQQANAVVATLTGKIDALRAEAKAKRAAASALRQQAAGGTAQAGLPIIQEAATAMQQADGLDAQALLLEAERTSRQTDAQARQARADALVSEKRRLEADLALLTAKAQNDKTLATDSASIAQLNAKTIAEQVAAYKALAEGDLAAARKRAVAGYQEALAHAKVGAKGGSLESKTAQVAAGSGKLAVASASQALADVQATQARSQEALAATLSLLASAQPPLPGATDYQAGADEATKNFDDLIAQARESYAAVRESLDGVTNETLKARLTGALAGLELLSSKQGVTPEQVAPPGLASPASSEQAAVAKALDEYLDIQRTMDIDAMLNAMNFENPEHREALRSMAEMSKLLTELDKLTTEKLGKPLKDLPGLGMLGTMGADATKDALNRTSADYNIVITGNLAIATAKKPAPMEPPAKFLLTKEQWVMTIDAQTGAMLAQAGQMVGPIKGVLTGLVEGLKDGSIKDEQQLMAILQAKLGGMMPGGK
ncbi:MAG: hypothetical protein LW822_10695 [Phycisphaeraceae bacterium]|nr:hypothetical protein [Phycisphaeraceae bacterium]